MRKRFLSLPPALRARFAIFALFVAALFAVFFLRVLPQLRIETDILALLPRTQQEAALNDALAAFSARLARRQVFLVGARDAAIAKQAARAFADELRRSQAFTRVDLQWDGDASRRFDVYLRHRAYLLSKQDITALQAGNLAALEQQALRAAYTPAGLMQAASLSDDPIGFLNRFLQGQMSGLGRVQLDAGVPVVEGEGRAYALITTETDGSPFASAVQERAMPAIERARQAAQATATAEIEVISSGAMQHAAAATERAKFEISTFGAIEMACVVALLWLIFGGLRPLALAAMALTIASLTALTAAHFIFGTVHILALVFGSSLIGGVIDYSIHFFADRFRDPLRWTPIDAARHVSGAVLFGLTATLISYAVLASAPFPGLKQIAAFCAVGLAAGCGCVLCWYPFFAWPGRKALPSRGGRIGAAIDRFMIDWRWSALRIVATAAVLLALTAGVLRARVQDDVRALQESPRSLVQQEQRVRALLGSGVETRFFLVGGDSEQALLEAEQALTNRLDDLLASGALDSYQAVSVSAPPLKQQQLAQRLLAEQVYAPNALLERVMRALGFSSAAIELRRRQFQASAAPLSVQEWLPSPAADGARHLWLGQVGARYASIVTLGGIGDVAALTAVQTDGARLIDRVAETSDVLTRYRRILTALLALTYVAVGCMLALRFGWRDAPLLLAPSALAAAVTVGAFGWLDVPINLFTLLALWLTLGLGVDYGVFLRHGQASRDPASRATAVLSVTLSACTTLLAFGLLALSATPFIRSIGLTLLCAIILSWLFVLFGCLTLRRERDAAASGAHG